jgi:hypothetical protein
MSTSGAEVVQEDPMAKKPENKKSALEERLEYLQGPQKPPRIQSPLQILQVIRDVYKNCR